MLKRGKSRLIDQSRSNNMALPFLRVMTLWFGDVVKLQRLQLSQAVCWHNTARAKVSLVLNFRLQPDSSCPRSPILLPSRTQTSSDVSQH